MAFLPLWTFWRVTRHSVNWLTRLSSFGVSSVVALSRSGGSSSGSEVKRTVGMWLVCQLTWGTGDSWRRVLCFSIYWFLKKEVLNAVFPSTLPVVNESTRYRKNHNAVTKRSYWPESCEEKKADLCLAFGAFGLISCSDNMTSNHTKLSSVCT